MSLNLIDAAAAVVGLSLGSLLLLALLLHLVQSYLLDCHCDCRSVFADYCCLCNDLLALPQLLSNEGKICLFEFFFIENHEFNSNRKSCSFFSP